MAMTTSNSTRVKAGRLRVGGRRIGLPPRGHADPGEKVNVQDRHPEVVAELTRLLEKQVADGRSTPGPPQKNAVAVDVWKAGREAMRPKK